MKFGTRLTVVAAAFVAMFGVLGIRLWFVQVAEGAQSAEIAEEQTWVRIDSQAPRGDIVDRTGVVIATSRFVPRVVVDRRFVDPADKDALIQRLSGLLGLPASELDALLRGGRPQRPLPRDRGFHRYRLPNLGAVLRPAGCQHREGSGEGVSGRSDHGPRDRTPRPARRSRISKPDPNSIPTFASASSGSKGSTTPSSRGHRAIPSSGLNRQSEVVEERLPIDPVQGATLQLTLDLRLQEVVEQALASGVVLANDVKNDDRAAGNEVNHDATRAAAVVLDVTNGEILALASVPDFDPSLFVGGVDSATFQALNDEKAFNNLAVSGLYPPASTFKVVTYVSAIEDNLPLAEENLDPSSGLIHCNGTLRLPGFEEGSQQVFHDWYTGDKGWLDIHAALEQSCNIYFWSVALGTWRAHKLTDQESIIQDWARDLGYGSLNRCRPDR